MPSSRYHSGERVFCDESDVVRSIGCALMAVATEHLAMKDKEDARHLKPIACEAADAMPIQNSRVHTT